MTLIDLHCHLLPYVDDGAANLEEALELLDRSARQGVTEICLTPHLRSHMFDTPDETIREKFSQLRQAALERAIPVKLHLSREYYFDDRFRRLLSQGSVMPMGQDVLLTEFSYGSGFEALREAVELILNEGYTPLLAHVERYRAFQEDPNCGKPLMEMGALLQLNAASVTGQDGRKTQRLCQRLLASGCIHVVASDSHDPELRAPYLGQCADYLEKKIGRANALRLTRDNPLAILNSLEEE